MLLSLLGSKQRAILSLLWSSLAWGGPWRLPEAGVRCTLWVKDPWRFILSSSSSLCLVFIYVGIHGGLLWPCFYEPKCQETPVLFPHTKHCVLCSAATHMTELWAPALGQGRSSSLSMVNMCGNRWVQWHSCFYDRNVSRVDETEESQTLKSWHGEQGEHSSVSESFDSGHGEELKPF